MERYIKDIKYNNHMETETTIKVKGKTLLRFNKMKYALDAKNHDKTLNKILDIVEKMENQK